MKDEAGGMPHPARIPHGDPEDWPSNTRTEIYVFPHFCDRADKHTLASKRACFFAFRSTGFLGDLLRLLLTEYSELTLDSSIADCLSLIDSATL